MKDKTYERVLATVRQRYPEYRFRRIFSVCGLHVLMRERWRFEMVVDHGIYSLSFGPLFFIW